MSLLFKHIKLESIASTNVYLHQLSTTSNIDEGMVVSTNHQTNGKGQKGNVWEVKANENLTFSVLLKPNILPKYAFYLNIISALAVQKTLSDLNIEAQIKWPNDILVDQQKIAGILVENQIGNTINQSIIGVGLNVNQLSFNEKFNATSIHLQTQSTDSTDVLNQLLGYLKFYYNLVQESNYKLLLKLYYKHLFLYNKQGLFNDGNSDFHATVIGVSEIGLLNLKKTTGEVCAYDIKEVKFIF